MARGTTKPQTIKRKVSAGTLDVDGRDASQARRRRRLRPLSARGHLAWSRRRRVVASPSTPAGTPHRKPPKPRDPRRRARQGRATSRATPPSCASPPRTAARRSIAVLGNGLHAMQQVDIPKGGGDVDIKVGDNWGPGAYATAILYRPMDEKAEAHAEPRHRREMARPRPVGAHPQDRADARSRRSSRARTLTVPVKVSGLAAGEEARLTVAAVDVGILNLTRFQAPAPESHFYAQRMLGAGDPRLLRPPDRRHARRARQAALWRRRHGWCRPAGQPAGRRDRGALLRHRSRRRRRHRAGRVRAARLQRHRDADGRRLEQGQARPRAKRRHRARQAGADRVRPALRDARRREPASTSPSTTSRARQPTTPSPSTACQRRHRHQGRRAQACPQGRRAQDANASPSSRPTSASRPTTSSVTGPDGIDVKRRLTLDVKVPVGDVKRTIVTSLTANTGKLTLSKDLVAGLIPERTRITLERRPCRRPRRAGPAVRARPLPLRLRRADRLARHAAALRQRGRRTSRHRHRQGAARHACRPPSNACSRCRTASGAFGVWGPSDADLWLTAYVTDFLTRAKESGYTVRPHRASPGPRPPAELHRQRRRA